MTTVTLQGNPDGGFISSTEFDKAIWEESRRLAPILKNHIEVVKDRRIPSENWLASLIQAFASVAYKNKREYKREDFLSWWEPMIKKENPMLDNVTKVLYPYKFDRGIGGLRELREQGIVTDLIWRPWTVTKFSHKQIGPLEVLKSGGNKLYVYALIGVAIYAGVPAIIKAFSNRK